VAACIDAQKPAVKAALDGGRKDWSSSTIALTPEAPPGNHAGLTIGGYTDAAGGHFDYTFGRNGSGDLDDLRIYGRALGDQELAMLAEALPAPGEEVRVVAAQPSPLTANPVFSSGEEGYAAFRIPSIVRAANGNLVALAEGRVQSASDAAATIRIVSKISRDDGRSWGPLRVVARNFVAGAEFAAMNASPVVDTVHGTGRIVLLFKKLECSEWQIAQGRGLMRTFSIVSDDHGESWHAERDITGQVHHPYQPAYRDLCPAAAQPENQAHEWRIQVPTLGHAIQLRGGVDSPSLRGRLLHVGSRTRGDASVFAGENYLFWSDDLGDTWQIGPTITMRSDGSPAKGLNEATVVELSDGRIMVNSRNYQNEQPVRQRAVTIGSFDDRGQCTFEAARHDRTLIEPAVQASLLRYSWDGEVGGDGRSRILFANPAHPTARVQMTVRLSYDDGETWPVAKMIDPGPGAYSDLVVQANGDIGLLYERGNAGGIVYTSLSLAWLTDGQDTCRQEATHHG
jgi:Neuraminidase (sialidase)